MKCVAQVHEELIALLVESHHDVVVRELLSVNQMCCRDADGVCGPQLQLGVTLLQIQGGTGCFTQEWVDRYVRDEYGPTTLVL